MTTLIITENDAGQRLDKYLQRYLPKAGSGFLYKMLRKKNITRNGKKAEGSERLNAGDEIRLFLSDDTIIRFRSDAAAHTAVKAIDVLHEDTDMLAVSKPAGILTQRDRSGEESLTDRVTGHLLASGEITEESLLHFRPSPANRLDRNTSGIVLFGKTLRGQQAAAEVIRAKEVKKHYLTLVKGRFPKELEDRAYLIKDKVKNISSIVAEPGGAAEEIRTVFKPLHYYPGPEGDGVILTLLDIQLLTGKPHQIRARLNSLHYPPVGDPKYGDPALNRIFRSRYGLRYQLLHAYRMNFSDSLTVPENLRGFTLEAPCPELFERILRELEHGKKNETRGAG